MMIYEDQLVKAELAKNAAVNGHVIVQPQKDVKELRALSEDESAHLFLVASYTAAILFQGIQAEGTNIILDEAGERLTVHVVARKSEDGLDYQWTPQQLDEAVMQEVEEKIKDKTFYLGNEDAAPTKGDKRPPPPSPKEKKVISKEEAEENYLIQQLIRIP